MLDRRKFLKISCTGIGAALTGGKSRAAEARPNIASPAEDISNAADPNGTGPNGAGSGAPIPAGTAPGGGAPDPAGSAAAVLRRTLGAAAAAKFELEAIPRGDEGREAFEFAAAGGVVSLKGSSGVALARAAYTYLRGHGLGMVCWSGRRLALPARLPDSPAQRTVCPYRFFQYLNPCTFGYSAAFWDWDRWQRELDWMALHGITMPLAMEGQEAVWETVWRSFGMTRSEWDRFTVGPAHLPWHRMGNINRLYGPLPPGWIRRKRDLQTRILARMTELGMTPVVPAFAGHVPEAFLRLYPSASIRTLLWDQPRTPSLPLQTKTFFLDPSEGSLFREIGRRFIAEYKRVFGVGGYYLADPFNEVNPPVREADKLPYLRSVAQAIYGGITAGDPSGTWVMQGWMFVSSWQIWDRAATRVLLEDIPDDRMIILDYTDQPRGTELAWRKFDAFYGKRWIQAMAHTFGGNNNIKGDLRRIAAQPAETLADPRRGRLAGWGLLMEGIENNEVVYELMTDVGWSAQKIDLDAWLPRYCRSRYGACPPAMREAWKLLLDSAYAADGYRWSSHHGYQMSPSLKLRPQNIFAGPVFRQAVDRFLACAPELAAAGLYRNDLIELVAQAVGAGVDARLAAACAAHEAGNPRLRDRTAAEALALLSELDAWMDRRPDRRLSTWVEAAKTWAENAEESAYYDSNARCLLTFWGWIDQEDYASRVWSGLIADYYRERWRRFFAVLSGTAPAENIEAWTQGWLSAPYPRRKPEGRPADLAETARRLLTRAQFAPTSAGKST